MKARVQYAETTSADGQVFAVELRKQGAGVFLRGIDASACL